MAARVRRNARPDLDIVANTRKQLESEVAKHVDAITDLKGRINAMAPISKLPPELLSAIFTDVATHRSTGEPLRSRSGTASAIPPYRWITLTHVCHSWRIIALNTPRLWSRIFLTRHDATCEVLARSKKAPLWVTANLSYLDEPRRVLLDVIMKESSRLKELSVTGPTRLLENLYPRWTGQATLLESLSLSDDTVFDSVSMPLFVEYPSFPMVFQGTTPNLRHLNVRHVAIGWDNPLFCSTLTSLTVLSRFHSTPRLGNFGQLLQALGNMSRLESLELDEAIPHVDEDPASAFTTPLQRVTLPNLRQLCISSDAVNCTHFLSFVTLPPTARLLITGRTEEAVEELVRLFTAHLARAPPLLTARISPTRSAQVLVRGWRAVLEDDTCCVSPSALPDAELILDSFPRARAVQHLKACAPALARVRRLDIQPLFGAWDWHGFFNHTPELRVLSVSGHPEGSDLIQALSEVRAELHEDGAGEHGQDEDEGEGEESRNSRRMVLPELHTLRMSGVRFEYADVEDDSAYRDHDLEEMVDWLIARCNDGAPLATLELRECINAGCDGVDRLDELVPDVVWDGYEMWDEELQDHQDMMLDEMYGGADAGDWLPLFPEWDVDYAYEEEPEEEFDFQWIPF